MNVCSLRRGQIYNSCDRSLRLEFSIASILASRDVTLGSSDFAYFLEMYINNCTITVRLSSAVSKNRLNFFSIEARQKQKQKQQCSSNSNADNNKKLLPQKTNCLTPRDDDDDDFGCRQFFITRQQIDDGTFISRLC